METLTFTRIVRIATGIVGALVVLVGLIALGIGEPAAGLWALIAGSILVLAAALEAARYRPKAADHERGAGFQPTAEVFLDPTTGQRMRVWFDPATGERRYETDEAGR